MLVTGGVRAVVGDSPTGLVVGRADACTMVCVCRCWLDRLLGAGAVACVEAFAGPRVSAVSRAVVGVAGLALSGVALGRFQGHRAGALLSRTCTTEVCLHWQCGPRGLCGAEFVGLGLSRLAVLRVGLCRPRGCERCSSGWSGGSFGAA